MAGVKKIDLILGRVQGRVQGRVLFLVNWFYNYLQNTTKMSLQCMIAFTVPDTMDWLYK